MLMTHVCRYPSLFIIGCVSELLPLYSIIGSMNFKCISFMTVHLYAVLSVLSNDLMN